MSRRISENFIIADPLGIHARPAAALAIAIARSGACVTLRYGAKTADAKSVVQLLSLGARVQATVCAEIEGDEEAIASAQLALAEHLARAD